MAQLLMESFPSDHQSFRELAVHEAGHALVAYLRGIFFHEVRIVGQPAVDFNRDLHTEVFDDPDTSEDTLRRYQLIYAAGAAAEELFTGSHRQSAAAGDKQEHARCRGTNFDGDVQEVKALPRFTTSFIDQIAIPLERNERLSFCDVEGPLVAAGIRFEWWNQP